jgi:hypothetical protein
MALGHLWQAPGDASDDRKGDATNHVDLIARVAFAGFHFC